MKNGFFILAFIVAMCICAASNHCETLSGDSSIFGRLKETHTAVFEGDRSVKLLDNQIILFKKKYNLDKVEALEVPSLRSLWSISGSYYFIQPSEGLKSKLILYRGDSEGPEITGCDFTGKKIFTLPLSFDGGIESSPSGNLFYTFEWGINGTDFILRDKNGNEVKSNWKSSGCNYSGRLLNDSVIVAIDCFRATVFSVLSGNIYDTLVSPDVGAGGKMARSRFGGQVAFNWRFKSYFVNSEMKFMEIKDTAISVQLTEISDDGKTALLLTSGLSPALFAYHLPSLKRIWMEPLNLNVGHNLNQIQILHTGNHIVCPYTEIFYPNGYEKYENREYSTSTLVLKLDPETGEILHRETFDGSFLVRSIGDSLFSVQTETANDSTKVTLKLWQ